MVKGHQTLVLVNTCFLSGQSKVDVLLCMDWFVKNAPPKIGDVIKTATNILGTLYFLHQYSTMMIKHHSNVAYCIILTQNLWQDLGKRFNV